MLKATLSEARETRLNADITVTQLAAQAGVSTRTVNYVENGTPVKLSTVKKIAKVLRMAGDYIVIRRDV